MHIKDLLCGSINPTKSNYIFINRLLLILISGVILLPLQQAKSNQIFLKCIGQFEINRGPLIKPDWETSYLRINLNGLTSTVNDNGDIKKGKTFIRGNIYTIKHFDNRNNIKNVYKINRTYGTYLVEYQQINRILIGTCQKSRG